MTNPPLEPGDQPAESGDRSTPHNAGPAAQAGPADRADRTDPAAPERTPPANDQSAPAAGMDAALSGPGGMAPVAKPPVPNPAASAYPPPPPPPPSSGPYPSPPGTGYGQPNPGYGYGYGYPSPPSTPAARPGGRKNGLVVGVIGLVVGVGIGALGIAVATGGDDDPKSTAGTALTASAPATTAPAGTAVASATPTGTPGPAEGDYSLSAVSNACNLIDPRPVTKWSSTPDGEPKHYETQPSSLRCDASYTTLSKVDDVHYNQAGITVEAELTDSGADPAYDDWKQTDTGTTGSGLDSGTVADIGSQAYWASASVDPSNTRLSYVIAAQDSNISVRVRIAISLAEGEPSVDTRELDAIARSEVRMALNSLKKK